MISITSVWRGAVVDDIVGDIAGEQRGLSEGEKFSPLCSFLIKVGDSGNIPLFPSSPEDISTYKKNHQIIFISCT
jgi:hypothetical protein